MNIFATSNLCHSVVPSPWQDMTGLLCRARMQSATSIPAVRFDVRFTEIAVSASMSQFKAP